MESLQNGVLNPVYLSQKQTKTHDRFSYRLLANPSFPPLFSAQNKIVMCRLWSALENGQHHFYLHPTVAIHYTPALFKKNYSLQKCDQLLFYFLPGNKIAFLDQFKLCNYEWMNENFQSLSTHTQYYKFSLKAWFLHKSHIATFLINTQTKDLQFSLEYLKVHSAVCCSFKVLHIMK